MSIESEINKGLNLDKVFKGIANAKARKIIFSCQMHFLWFVHSGLLLFWSVII